MILSTLLSQKEQLAPALRSSVSRVYLEYDLVPDTEFPEITQVVKEAGKEVFLAFPYIVRSWTAHTVENALENIEKAGFTGFLVRSLESLAFLKEHGIKGEIVSDHTLYGFNGHAVSVLKDMGIDRVTVPLELNRAEISETGFQNEEMVLYGRTPMMITENCVHKTLRGCDKRNAESVLTDRMGHKLPVLSKCAFCYNVIYNALPLNLCDAYKDIRAFGLQAARMDFTMESREETERILFEFDRAFLRGLPVTASGEFTRLHFKRGVE